MAQVNWLDFPFTNFTTSAFSFGEDLKTITEEEASKICLILSLRNSSPKMRLRVEPSIRKEHSLKFYSILDSLLLDFDFIFTICSDMLSSYVYI
jgi:hypothetical protein